MVQSYGELSDYPLPLLRQDFPLLRIWHKTSLSTADSLKRYSSQRDKQKGEDFVHGFTLAMTSQCQFYRPISELDNEGGYADSDMVRDAVKARPYIVEFNKD